MTAPTMYLQRLRRCAPALLIVALLLTGCGVGTVQPTSSTVATLQLTGRVHGGQQPVSGAALQLYAAGSTGNGSAATPLIPTGNYAPGGAPCPTTGNPTCYPNVVSDANGNFTITGDYTCPSASAQTYIVASGGNPGLAAGTSNAQLVMVAALGSCSTLTPTRTLNIDEVTTVAAAWALAAFAEDAAHIGSSSSNTAGLGNAFLDAALLADSSTGLAATLPGNLSIETGKLYALANALSGCVNSTGGGNCSPLFAAATPQAGTVPADTFTAALNIVQNPGRNVVPVYDAIPPTPPFAGQLAQAPNDWTMSLTVTGGNLVMPQALAVDALNNVWVIGQAGPLVEYSPQGTPLSGTGYGSTFPSGTTPGVSPLTQNQAIAVDIYGNLWIPNYNSPYNAAGAVTAVYGALSGQPGTLQSLLDGVPAISSGVAYPIAVSADNAGNVFIANNGNLNVLDVQLNELVSNGSSIASVQSRLQGEPNGIAADGHGGYWLSDGSSYVYQFTAAGSLAGSSSCGEPYGIALDQSGNAWTACYLDNSLIMTSPGSSSALVTATGGGLYRPAQVAVDAAQHVWVSNLFGNSISEFTGIHGAQPGGTPISPTTGTYNKGGYGLDAGLSSPFSVVPDPSGNLWVCNQSNNAAQQGYVTMFFGLATPTATPIRPTPTAP